MDKIKQKYINTDKANLRFVNASVLGDDSIYKSVVSYSLYEHTASNKLYWKLNRRFYEEQTKDKQHKTSQGLDGKHPTQNAVKVFKIYKASTGRTKYVKRHWCF